MTGKKPPPDWDKFEVYKGEDPGAHRPAWVNHLIHWTSMAVLLVITFCIGGTLLYLSIQQSGPSRTRLWHALHETKTTAWTEFIAGGVIADVIVLGWIYGRSSRKS